jgi:hypothetical protein
MSVLKVPRMYLLFINEDFAVDFLGDSSRQNVQQGRFTGTRRTNNADQFAWLGDARDLIENGLLDRFFALTFLAFDFFFLLYGVIYVFPP